MNRLDRYTRYASSIFGLSIIILAALMLSIGHINAELSEGFKTPIIAFEFARSEADLKFLSGTSAVSVLNREKMDAAHSWDMVFPFAYAGLLALLMVQLIRSGQKFVVVGLIPALLIIPFDINENFTLLEISAALANSTSIPTLLTDLYFATWLKWGAIGISAAILAAGFAANKERLSAAISLLAALSVAICWASNSKPVITEAMSSVISLFFLTLTLKSFFQSWSLLRKRPKRS